MHLTGSRATPDHDEFSDWDYAIDELDDLRAIETETRKALCWMLTRKGTLRIVTLIHPNGAMHDYTAREPLDEAFWPKLDAAKPHRALAEYWIIAFKHLKAIHRGYDLLFDVGLEISTGLARDLYVEKHFGAGSYKDFFSFKRIPANHDFSALFAVTGQPTATGAERIRKLVALNASVANLFPQPSAALATLFEERLELARRG